MDEFQAPIGEAFEKVQCETSGCQAMLGLQKNYHEIFMSERSTYNIAFVIKGNVS